MTTGVIPPKYVNSHQSQAERSARYQLYRSFGCNSYVAAMLRDWREPFANWYLERWILRSDLTETHSQIRNRLLKEYKESI